MTDSRRFFCCLVTAFLREWASLNKSSGVCASNIRTNLNTERLILVNLIISTAVFNLTALVIVKLNLIFIAFLIPRQMACNRKDERERDSKTTKAYCASFSRRKEIMQLHAHVHFLVHLHKNSFKV